MGKINHVTIDHQKVTIVILQKSPVIYYVTISKKEKDLANIISEIKRLV